MDIYTCPRCGSKKIFQGRLKEGVLTGYTDRYVCRDCGYQGSPLIFDNIDEYNKFEMQKKSDKTIGEAAGNQVYDSEIVLSEKEKEVVGFLNELGDNLDSKTRSLLPVILSAILISLLIISFVFVSFDFFTSFKNIS